ERRGSFKLQNNFFERTTPSAPAVVASRYFLNGHSHPTFPKEGNSLQNPQLRQKSNAYTSTAFSRGYVLTPLRGGKKVHLYLACTFHLENHGFTPRLHVHATLATLFQSVSKLTAHLRPHKI